jgi:hypothetical protein
MVLRCLPCILLHRFNDPFTVNLVEVHFVGVLVFCEYFVCGFHGLNDFGDGHPIKDFAGKPRKIPRVPHVKACNIPSNDLHSLHIGYQYLYPVLGHLVLGAYPGHGQAFK